MKKFKFSLASLLIVLVAVIVHSILLSGNKAPDAGLEVFSTVAFGVLLIGIGLLLDLYFTFTNSRKPAIRSHQGFWRIIGAVAFVGIIYFVYYSLST